MEKSIVFLKARRCGFSKAVRAKFEADIKAGKKVYFGIDYANGESRSAEIVKHP